MQDAAFIDSNSGDTGAAVPRPLYRQVREMLLSRIDQGQWSIGEALPNELQLSAQFGVSIGTIRKAIDYLEETGVVVRKQGRGTYLASSQKKKMIERFNPLRLTSGERPALMYRLESVSRRAPGRDEIARLKLEPRVEVHVITQTLLLGHNAVGQETTCLDARLIPELETRLGGGQDLYGVYAQCNLAITRAEDAVNMSNKTILSIPCESRAQGLVWVLGRLAWSATRPIEHKTGCYDASQLIYAGNP